MGDDGTDNNRGNERNQELSVEKDRVDNDGYIDQTITQ